MRLHASLRPTLTAVLLVSLGTFGANSARAALSVTGGTASQQQALTRAFSAVPSCCNTSCSVCVRLLGDQEMDACLQASAAAHSQRILNAGAVDGFYQDGAKVITLRAPSATADVSTTFTHEYGHYVWMNVLSPAQRDQYRKVYDTQRAAGRLVSPYAAVSVEEGFAEAFSFYIQRRPLLVQKDLSSCCFLDGLVDVKAKQH